MPCSKSLITSRALGVLLACAALLSGCGGGGGGDEEGPSGPVIPASLAAVQGFWGGPLDASTTGQAVVLPDGNVWLVVQSGNTVLAVGRAQAVITPAGASATGNTTEMASGLSQPLTMTASSVVAKHTVTGTVTARQATNNVSWTYSTTYDTPLLLADVAGQWTGTASQQQVGITLDISAAGVLPGSSTTGCSYSGALAKMQQAVAVLSAHLTETCAGASNTFNGIATVNEAKNRASLVLGTAAGTQFTLIPLQK